MRSDFTTTQFFGGRLKSFVIEFSTKVFWNIIQKHFVRLLQFKQFLYIDWLFLKHQVTETPWKDSSFAEYLLVSFWQFLGENRSQQ